jgi:hypothetical protein
VGLGLAGPPGDTQDARACGSPAFTVQVAGLAAAARPWSARPRDAGCPTHRWHYQLAAGGLGQVGEVGGHVAAGQVEEMSSCAHGAEGWLWL